MNIKLYFKAISSRFKNYIKLMEILKIINFSVLKVPNLCLFIMILEQSRVFSQFLARFSWFSLLEIGTFHQGVDKE